MTLQRLCHRDAIFHGLRTITRRSATISHHVASTIAATQATAQAGMRERETHVAVTKKMSGPETDIRDHKAHRTSAPIAQVCRTSLRDTTIREGDHEVAIALTPLLQSGADAERTRSRGQRKANRSTIRARAVSTHLQLKTNLLPHDRVTKANASTAVTLPPLQNTIVEASTDPPGPNRGSKNPQSPRLNLRRQTIKQLVPRFSPRSSCGESGWPKPSFWPTSSLPRTKLRKRDRRRSRLRFESGNFRFWLRLRLRSSSNSRRSRVPPLTNFPFQTSWPTRRTVGL